MTERLDAVAVRKYTSNGEEKSAYTNIGVAFPMKDKPGFSLKLHCVPAPVDGEYFILLMPTKPRDEQAPRTTGRSISPSFGDDEPIPF